MNTANWHTEKHVEFEFSKAKKVEKFCKLFCVLLLKSFSSLLIYFFFN